jgi:hypothetical protein
MSIHPIGPQPGAVPAADSTVNAHVPVTSTFPDWPAHAIEPAHKTTATNGAAIQTRRRFMIPSLTPRASGAACLPAYDLLVGKVRMQAAQAAETTSGRDDRPPPTALSVGRMPGKMPSWSGSLDPSVASVSIT